MLRPVVALLATLVVSLECVSAQPQPQPRMPSFPPQMPNTNMNMNPMMNANVNMNPNPNAAQILQTQTQPGLQMMGQQPTPFAMPTSAFNPTTTTNPAFAGQPQIMNTPQMNTAITPVPSSSSASADSFLRGGNYQAELDAANARFNQQIAEEIRQSAQQYQQAAAAADQRMTQAALAQVPELAATAVQNPNAFRPVSTSQAQTAAPTPEYLSQLQQQMLQQTPQLLPYAPDPTGQIESQARTIYEQARSAPAPTLPTSGPTIESLLQGQGQGQGQGARGGAEAATPVGGAEGQEIQMGNMPMQQRGSPMPMEMGMGMGPGMRMPMRANMPAPAPAAGQRRTL